MIRFDGKTVLITGASKGIGAACAVRFGKAGAHVAVHYHLDETGAETVAGEVRRAGGNAATFRADLRNWSAAEPLIEQVESSLGPIHVAVINHGIWKEAAIDAMTEQQFQQTIRCNLLGVMSVVGAVVRRMKPRGLGRLVLVSSTAGQRGEALHSHYAASKGAVISLTKSLASELAPHGILVNCVAPGWVDTPMSADSLANEQVRQQVLSTIPLRRVGLPDEIAQPIAFLASDAASFITGEILNVNGGAVLVG